MNKSTVVILGGGIGGIVTANKLAKLLPLHYEITLIEKNEFHYFAASFLWQMVNKRKQNQVTSSLRKLIDGRVKILFEEVKQIDAENKLITTEKNQLHFEYLVIALGATVDQSPFSQNHRDVHNYYTVEGAENLRNALQKFRGGKISLIVSSLPYKCPGAPYEGAMLIKDFYIQRQLEKNVSVDIYTPENLPLPVAGPELGNSVKEILDAKGIGFYPLQQTTSINYNEKKIAFASGLSVDYDLLVLIPQHKAPEVISKSALADESGWVPVDKGTLETKYKNVFALGDVTSITIPGRWAPDKPLKLPKAGVFAHAQALVVSEIIASRISGIETNASFCGDGFCMLEAGEDLAGFAYGDFFASPHPDVKMKNAGIKWHLGKVLFEKWWLSPIGFTKSFYKMMIEAGAKTLGIPIKL
ncbi:MAG: NAD(P)/FAD-dependent oxidoreductase [Ignavibacteriales bacterium]|nr:NAD(P)/FAD-dependent oxidoreductase [Ignavibacteriales bacterium]